MSPKQNLAGTVCTFLCAVLSHAATKTSLTGPLVVFGGHVSLAVQFVAVKRLVSPVYQEMRTEMWIMQLCI